MKGIDKAGSIFLRAVLRRMKELGLNQSELARRMNASRKEEGRMKKEEVWMV